MERTAPVKSAFVKPMITKHGALGRLTLQTGGLTSGGTFFGSAASGQWVYDDEDRTWVWVPVGGK
jgi:hypothetical protein